MKTSSVQKALSLMLAFVMALAIAGAVSAESKLDSIKAAG